MFTSRTDIVGCNAELLILVDKGDMPGIWSSKLCLCCACKKGSYSRSLTILCKIVGKWSAGGAVVLRLPACTRQLSRVEYVLVDGETRGQKPTRAAFSTRQYLVDFGWFNNMFFWKHPIHGWQLCDPGFRWWFAGRMEERALKEPIRRLSRMDSQSPA